MRFVKWECEGFVVPMVEDDSGELYCTTKGIAGALGVTAEAVYNLYARNREEFTSGLRLTDRESKGGGLSVTDRHTKEFFQSHKKEFGISRLRDDMHLWSEDDVFTLAFLARSSQGRLARRGFRQFLKENTRKNYVSREEYNALLEQVREYGTLSERVRQLESAIPAVGVAASAAGTALRAHRGTKHLRRIK